MPVDGRYYGFALDGIDWYDSRGGAHEGGKPACLQVVGETVRIRFGVVPATGSNGESWGEVTWVDCLP